jgi:hypothetical protein
MRVGEILENGAESMKPMDVEDHVVAYQGNDKEFQDEFLPGNAEFDVLADAVAGDLVLVRHRHLETWLEQGLKVEAAGCVQRDEGVGGVEVNQGGDDDVLDVDQQLHRLDGRNARDDIERYQGHRVVQLIRVLRCIHLEQEPTLHRADCNNPCI